MPHSAGYQDYEPPRDPETRQEREVRRAAGDDAAIHRVGWAIFTMRTAQSRTTRTHAQTLLAVYKGIGRPRKDMARRLALDAFGRVFLAWAEQIDGPINSL